MARILLLIASLSLLIAPRAHAAENELLSDAIVASVDGTPITLRDVTARLEPARSLKASTAAQDGHQLTGAFAL